jgi:hypothetical protein
VGPAEVARLADAPHLSGLEALAINSFWFGDARLRLPRLKELTWHLDRIGAAAAVALAAAPGLAGLTRLNLAYNDIDDAGAAARAAHPT